MEPTEYTWSDAQERLSSLIANNESFVVFGLSGSVLEAARVVEKEVEVQRKRCRVYTRNRAAAAVATSWIPVVSWVNVLGIAAHNALTFNPDYEIGKDLVGNKLYVTYKKG